MTWTYDPTLSTDLARVRLAVGDTNTNDQLLSDEEISSFLADYPDVEAASIRAVEAIIAKLARDVDRSNLGMSASRSQKVQHYRDLADRLQARADSRPTPLVGGVSQASKDTLAEDDDFVDTHFPRDWTRKDRIG